MVSKSTLQTKEDISCYINESGTAEISSLSIS